VAGGAVLTIHCYGFVIPANKTNKDKDNTRAHFLNSQDHRFSCVMHGVMVFDIDKLTFLTYKAPFHYSPNTFLARVGKGYNKREGRICKSFIHKKRNAINQE